MNKENTPPYVENYEYEVEVAHVKRQPPHIMCYCDGEGRSIDLYLCCFCNNLPDFSLSTPCNHFHLVSDISCPYFSEVSDSIMRVNQLIAAKEENQCVNGQT